MSAPVSGRTPFDGPVPGTLEEQRRFLLRSIEDLERERAAGDLDEHDYQTLRDGYTARAAAVLRALEQEGPAATPISSAVSPPRRGRRWVAAGVVAVLAVTSGLAVAASSGSRMPGETITGDIRQTVPGRLQQAAELAATGNYRAALEIYDEVLAEDPVNLEALSERGLLLVSLASATERPSLGDAGLASIDQALAIDPDNARALFYRGLGLRLKGDEVAANESFSAALAADPPPALRQAIEGFLASVDPQDGGGM